MVEKVKPQTIVVRIATDDDVTIDDVDEALGNLCAVEASKRAEYADKLLDLRLSLSQD